MAVAHVPGIGERKRSLRGPWAFFPASHVELGQEGAGFAGAAKCEIGQRHCGRQHTAVTAKSQPPFFDKSAWLLAQGGCRAIM